MNEININELIKNYKNDKANYEIPLFTFICKENATFICEVAQQNQFPLCYIRNFNINAILDKYIQNMSGLNCEENIRLDMGTLVLNEAIDAKTKNKYQVALILYATWIEHWFNDLINTVAVTKNLTDKEIEKLINSNFDAKLSYMLPLFNLPRIEKSIVKDINAIIETRNHLVHYKWKPISLNNVKSYLEKQIMIVNSAPDVVDYLVNYAKLNIFNEKYLFYILASLVFAQTGVDIRIQPNINNIDAYYN